MIIGLTGGIGSGKSVVSRIIESCAVRVVDSDAVAREVIESNSALLPKIRKLVGAGVFTKSRDLNRPALAKLIFENPEMRRRLERLLHPLIRRRILEEVRVAKRYKEHLVVTVPLLFEAGFTTPFGEVWVTAAPLKARISRLAARDGISAAEARRRIRVQMPQSQKIKRADRVIWTNVPIATLKARLHKMINTVLPVPP
ncbi:MAG: dephospho-CoA kinase [bacterium]